MAKLYENKFSLATAKKDQLMGPSITGEICGKKDRYSDKTPLRPFS